MILQKVVGDIERVQSISTATKTLRSVLVGTQSQLSSMAKLVRTCAAMQGAKTITVSSRAARPTSPYGWLEGPPLLH